jgi:HEAT repeat protein
MLDVTLSSAHKALSFPLIDPKLDRSKRLELLKQVRTESAMTADERLEELIEHGDQAWVRACAIYAVGLRGANGMVPLIESSLADPNPVVRETAAWSLYTLAPDRFDQHAAALLADPDVCVARLVAELVDASSSSSQ